MTRATDTSTVVEQRRAAFDAWFTPDVHNEKAIKVLGIRGTHWVAFQVGWEAAWKTLERGLTK